MAGRPRKRGASSSTAATADDSHSNDSHIRWSKESAILKPLPPDRIADEDEWPIFVLRDATIYRKDGKTLANPLLVHLQGPFVIRGLLEVDGDNIEYLTKPSVKSAYIEIPLSDRYSMGWGPITLWASGASGWFEIRPSPKFQPMYADVREAITLYFGLLEAHEQYELACGHKKKANWPPPPTLDEIFLKCAVKAGNGILRDELEALCHKWAEFLIGHFTRDAALAWNETRFAKWLRQAHPDVDKRIADAAKGILPPPPPSKTEESEDTKAQLERRSRSARASTRSSEIRDIETTTSKGRAKVETPVPLPEKYRQFVQASSSKPSPAPMDARTVTPATDRDLETPVGRLLDVLDEIARETDVRNASVPKVRGTVWSKCKIEKYQAAEEILAYYSKELIAGLRPEWKGTPFYTFLQGCAKTPFEPPKWTTLEIMPQQTFRRAYKGGQYRVGTLPSTTAAASDLPPAIGLGGRAKSAMASRSDGDSDDDTLAERRGRRSGKGATLRLASKKRPAPDSDGHESGSRRGRKSAKNMNAISDEYMDDDENSSDGEVEDTALCHSPPLPEGAVRLVIHAERIPTTSPKGPNGTWTCEEEGCGYVVRSAEEEAAQEQIREHFQVHEAQAEKISLAVKESRGQMPINHLLDKIQAIGKASLLKERDMLNGKPLPAPIKRRLLA